MIELISLAKDNAILVIGLLAVTLYLESRIDSESAATRYELSAMQMEISDIREDISGIRQDMHSFQLETTDRFARIETLLGKQARAI